MKQSAVVFRAAPTSRAAPATGLAAASVLLTWMLSEVIREETCLRKIGVIAGPNLARELAQSGPAPVKARPR